MIVARVQDLAEALLQTDIDAIAADDDHVVFTIRISRETLRRNHTFLGVISDLAGGADLPKRRDPTRISARKPSAKSRLRALMAGAFAALNTMRAA